MSVFKCKMCGGTLEINENQTVVTCEYCGTQQTLPRLDDERRANLYDRANHFRRNNDFDKAASIYEQILTEDTADAEAYWSLVLCKYGIEYVEDPGTRRRVPTINRAQFTAVFDDDNYKSALQYADGYQKSLYEQEAAAINEIQKGILAISQKEEPFDVFICYKETDQNGRRTPDSVLANDLYHQLTQEGFKVFFSRITLEDKLGTAYEPYIFAALNSAKVMVVLGTKPEYLQAVWVKNEWSRYLALVKQAGGKKVLIPAYKDMDPYDLPEEFSHLQAQDMGKLGFMQDLIRGIKKLTSTATPQAVVKETVVMNTATNAPVAPLLKRAFMFLEDGDWASADEYCEKVLDQDPENARAYLGKLMAELHVSEQDRLANESQPFDDRGNYQKVIRFADAALKAQLQGYLAQVRENSEQARKGAIYRSAISDMNTAKTDKQYEEIAKRFESIAEYKDSTLRATQCREKAKEARKNQVEKNKTQTEIELLKAKRRSKRIKLGVLVAIAVTIAATVMFVLLKTVIMPQNHYQKGEQFLSQEKYAEAFAEFQAAGKYKDSDLRLQEVSLKLQEELKNVRELLPDNRIISLGLNHTIGLQSDGTVVATGLNGDGRCDVGKWKHISAISAGYFHTVGLKTDGTVVAIGSNDAGQCNVGIWKEIMSISAGEDYTVGLKLDGTVLATGKNNSGQCDVSDWNNIVAIAASHAHTVGLKADGTVVATGMNGDNQCDVAKWNNIVAISAGYDYTVGLKADGTVVATGNNNGGRCDISEWKDIVAISAGDFHTVGLKADGTVVATGLNRDGQCAVDKWRGIVAIATGSAETVGVKLDGTVVAAGDNFYGRYDVGNWKDIRLPGDDN